MWTEGPRLDGDRGGGGSHRWFSVKSIEKKRLGGGSVVIGRWMVGVLMGAKMVFGGAVGDAQAQIGRRRSAVERKGFRSGGSEGRRGGGRGGMAARGGAGKASDLAGGDVQEDLRRRSGGADLMVNGPAEAWRQWEAALRRPEEAFGWEDRRRGVVGRAWVGWRQLRSSGLVEGFGKDEL